jgi:hypothetical protein
MLGTNSDLLFDRGKEFSLLLDAVEKCFWGVKRMFTDLLF